MAAVIPLTGPSCLRCAGGGEVNGVTCPECGGSRTGRRPRHRWGVRGPAHRVALALAAPAGAVVGWSVNLPGIGGAAAVSWGLADVVHAVVPQVPALGVLTVAAGVFGLIADRRL